MYKVGKLSQLKYFINLDNKRVFLYTLIFVKVKFKKSFLKKNTLFVKFIIH